MMPGSQVAFSVGILFIRTGHQQLAIDEKPASLRCLKPSAPRQRCHFSVARDHHHASTCDRLGFLLHKNPARAQSFDLSFGKAHVVYPEASVERCTAALAVNVDPVGLVRGRRGPDGDGGMLTQYVNDRPYAASSFLSVAISNVFGTAMTGRSKDRPELAETAMPLVVELSVALSVLR